MHGSEVTESLERFIAERGAGLHRAALSLTGDQHHAEDLLQTALAKSWDRYAALDNDHKFESFLRTTMYRTYVSWWRRMSWRSEITTAAAPEPSVAPADLPLHPQNLDLHRALGELPRMQRAVLVLRFLEDRSIADVAETLGIGQGTVKKYTHRGCASLRGSVHLAEEEMAHE